MQSTRSHLTEAQYEGLKRRWTGRYVRVCPDRPELKRFEGRIGRVATINWNNRALVDFQDGAWYDIAPQFLVEVDPAEAQAKYDPKINSAQPFPEKQGP